MTTTIATSHPRGRRTLRRPVVTLVAVGVAVAACRVAWMLVPDTYRPLVVVAGIIAAAAAARSVLGPIAGAVAATLVVLVAGWTLLIHPALESAASRAQHLVPSVPPLPSLHVPDVGGVAADAADRARQAADDVRDAAGAAQGAAGKASDLADKARDAVGDQP